MLRRKNESLELVLFVMVAICFVHSKSFWLYCDVWSCRCSCMGSISVLSCICCMFVFCVYLVEVFNAVFCMSCSLLMLVEDARGNHMEETYSRASLMSVSCLAHNGACTEMYAVCEFWV